MDVVRFGPLTERRQTGAQPRPRGRGLSDGKPSEH